jgi:hypothetical protein
MSQDRDAGCGIDRRSFVLGAGALASAGLVGAPSVAEARSRSGKGVLPEPEPIPGGSEFIPGQLYHVFVPGDPSVTLPFSGGPLGGLDVEPGTITDFDGSSAVAFHVGTAQGSDGNTYNLETDIRAFRGEYVVDGVAHRGSFALV